MLLAIGGKHVFALFTIFVDLDKPQTVLGFVSGKLDPVGAAGEPHSG